MRTVLIAALAALSLGLTGCENKQVQAVIDLTKQAAPIGCKYVPDVGAVTQMIAAQAGEASVALGEAVLRNLATSICAVVTAKAPATQALVSSDCPTGYVNGVCVTGHFVGD